MRVVNVVKVHMEDLRAAIRATELELTTMGKRHAEAAQRLVEQKQDLAEAVRALRLIEGSRPNAR